MASKSVTYVARVRVRHDGAVYAPGQPLPVSGAEAERLVALGAIGPVAATKEEKS